jgi:hypothetical protein
LGLGLLSRATIEQELALKRLVVLDVAEFPIMRHWYIVHRHGKRLSAPAEAFKQFVLADAKRILGGNAGPISRRAARSSSRASSHQRRYRSDA